MVCPILKSQMNISFATEVLELRSINVEAPGFTPLIIYTLL